MLKWSLAQLLRDVHTCTREFGEPVTWQAFPWFSDWWCQVYALEETWHSCTERWDYFSSHHKNFFPLLTMLWGWLILCVLLYSLGCTSTLSICEKIQPWFPFEGGLLGPSWSPYQGCAAWWCYKWQRAVHCWEKRHQAWCHRRHGPSCCGQVTSCTRALSLPQQQAQCFADVPSKSLRKTWWSWTAKALRITI